MQIEFLLNSASYFILSAVIVFSFFWVKKKELITLEKYLVPLSLAPLIPALINLLWFFEYIYPKKGEVQVILTVFYVIFSILTLLFMYQVTHNQKIPYYFLVYSFAVVGLIQNFELFEFYSIAISNLMLIFLFIDQIISSKKYVRLAYTFGMIQAFFVLLYTYFYWNNLELQWWFIPNILFGLFFVLMYIDRDLYETSHTINSMTKPKQIESQYVFLRYIIYMFALMSFMLISTVAVHESGHGVFAKLTGCEQAKIILYDFINMPHTEIICDTSENSILISLGGLIFTTITAIIFWLTEKKFSHISSLMFSIGILIAHRDFIDIGLTESLTVSLQIIAVVLIVVSIAKVAVDYLQSTADNNKHLNQDE